jgi:hypothetical protein
VLILFVDTNEMTNSSISLYHRHDDRTALLPLVGWGMHRQFIQIWMPILSRSAFGTGRVLGNAAVVSTDASPNIGSRWNGAKATRHKRNAPQR